MVEIFHSVLFKGKNEKETIFSIFDTLGFPNSSDFADFPDTVKSNIKKYEDMYLAEKKKQPTYKLDKLLSVYFFSPPSSHFHSFILFLFLSFNIFLLY